jgi:hypothetical protein
MVIITSCGQKEAPRLSLYIAEQEQEGDFLKGDLRLRGYFDDSTA